MPIADTVDSLVRYNRGKITNLEDPTDSIYFYVPEELNESIEASYDEQGDIIGRSSPYVAYKSTGARTVDISIIFFAMEDAEEEVLKKIRWLQSFLYPDYSGQIVKPPKMLRVMVGKGFIDIKGILKSCPVSWKSPYDTYSGLPFRAELTLNIQEVVNIPYDYRSFKPASMRAY